MLNQKFQYFYSTDNISFIPYGTSFFIPFGVWKGARIAPVSYTHLDVYKRQSYNNKNPQTDISI